VTIYVINGDKTDDGKALLESVKANAPSHYLVRTFSSGTILPSSNLSTGFIFSKVPTQACAPVISKIMMM
jgi:hypothetical protein